MIIQKFGGIAMRYKHMREHCIAHIRKGLDEHGAVIAVVSAIGRKGDPYATDSLLRLTDAFDYSPAAKDLAASCGELIASAVLSAELAKSGIHNKTLYGSNLGIVTNGEFGDATIDYIDTTAALRMLKDTTCLVVPGFQGMDLEGNVKTLGRGGSDLTAVALASALQASHAEFFKDVPGVLSKDPKTDVNAKKYDRLTYDEFILLLEEERPVIQKRAALFAKEKAIPLYVRGIATDQPGTWILP